MANNYNKFCPALIYKHILMELVEYTVHKIIYADRKQKNSKLLSLGSFLPRLINLLIDT